MTFFPGSELLLSGSQTPSTRKTDISVQENPLMVEDWQEACGRNTLSGKKNCA